MQLSRLPFVSSMLLVLSIVFITPAYAQRPQTEKYLDTSLSPAERAHDLVSKMTLEEKATQLED